MATTAKWEKARQAAQKVSKADRRGQREDGDMVMNDDDTLAALPFMMS